MVRDDVNHKVRLSDETSVASADNNDPIYILRKEIHDWRVSGQMPDRFERDCRLTENETEKNSVRGKKYIITIINLYIHIKTRRGGGEQGTSVILFE